MYYDNTLNKIKKFGLILSLILGFIVVTGTSTQAQWRDRDQRDNDRYDRNDDRSYRNNAAATARERGYREGFNEGQDDARDGRRYRPQGSNNWERGMNGYDSRHGNRNAYKQAYRSAYLQGYRAGYERYRNNRGFTFRIF